MGYFSNLQVDILDLYEEGLDPTAIARVTGATLTEVVECISQFEDGEFDGDAVFDGDPVEPDGDDWSNYSDAQALASAGFGTDEDYGYNGDE